MARLLDEILVIDVESTCWDKFEIPADEISEIIEIGISLVNLKSLEVHGKRSLFISPQRSSVSKFCTELTSITPEMLHGAPLLTAGIKTLREDYQSEERAFASWGDYDRNQFKRNCKSFGLRYPFGPTHLNIKTLFSMSFGIGRELELDHACEHVGVKMEGLHHRGADDAYNAGVLLALLLKRARRGIAG